MNLNLLKVKTISNTPISNEHSPDILFSYINAFTHLPLPHLTIPNLTFSSSFPFPHFRTPKNVVFFFFFIPIPPFPIIPLLHSPNNL